MTISLNGRRVGCRNSRWTVYLDDIVDGGGRRVEDFLVLAPNRYADPETLLTGAAVLACIGGCIALMNNDRHPVGGRSWEVVKGFIDAGETSAQAALRELTEETGHTCAPEDLIALGTFLPESAAMAARGALFLARDCVPGGERDDAELGLGKVHLFPIDEVLAMAARSEIEDAATLAALFRALPWLNGRADGGG